MAEVWVPVDRREEGDVDSTSADGDAADAADPAARVSVWRRGWAGGLQIIAIVAFVAAAVGFSREDAASSSSDAAGLAVSAPDPVAGAADDSAQMAPDTSLPPASGAATLVNVMVPQARAAQVLVNATGSVSVRNRIQLVPEVSGRVVEVSPWTCPASVDSLVFDHSTRSRTSFL